MRTAEEDHFPSGPLTGSDTDYGLVVFSRWTM
jgi:hypothetical protein